MGRYVRSRWEASTNPNIISGIAEFSVGGDEEFYRLKLESFQDFVEIERLLDRIYAIGRSDAVKELQLYLQKLG